MAKKKPKYEVLTWDTDAQKFTPQQGVRRGPYSLWGLKRAMRKLQAIGYPCNYGSAYGRGGDNCVRISRLD